MFKYSVAIFLLFACFYLTSAERPYIKNRSESIEKYISHSREHDNRGRHKHHHHKKHHVSYRNEIVCSEIKLLQCSLNQVLNIQSAIYGRMDVTSCPNNIIFPVIPDFTNCQSQVSTYYIQNLCNGENQCVIDNKTPLDTYFGDTYQFCKGFDSRSYYFNITYTCSEPIAFCSGKSVSGSCPDGKILTIISAIWGRTNDHTCSEMNDSTDKQNSNINCQSKDSTLAVQTICNGKTNCALKATSNGLGVVDPCFGTNKYLELAYTCSAPVYICLDFSTDPPRFNYAISCASNQILTINSALFGTSKPAICPNSKDITINGNCTATTLLTSIRTMCAGFSRCLIDSAILSNLPTACTGMYNFLQISYTCSMPSSMINAFGFGTF